MTDLRTRRVILTATLLLLAGCQGALPRDPGATFSLSPPAQQTALTTTAPPVASPVPSPTLPLSAPPAPTPMPAPTPAPSSSPLPRAAASGERWTIGRSVRGRPIDVYRFGRGTAHVAVIGGIHGGYEGNTVKLVQQMVRYFQDHPREVPAGVTLYLVPNANPDGYARGASDDGRLNGNGVDLNRNWDHNWQEYSPWWGNHTMYGGSSPFSEPETRALRDLIAGREIAAAIFYHSRGGFVTNPQHDAASAKLARCLAQATGYDLGGSSSLGYRVTGDAGSYLRGQGVAAVDIELSDHEDPEFERNIVGLLEGLECWLSRSYFSQSTNRDCRSVW